MDIVSKNKLPNSGTPVDFGAAWIENSERYKVPNLAESSVMEMEVEGKDEVKVELPPVMVRPRGHLTTRHLNPQSLHKFGSITIDIYFSNFVQSIHL